MMSFLEINNESIAKMELGLAPDNSLGVCPPFLDFSIEWAAPDDWTYVIERCKNKTRQTMNFGTSKSAKLLILRDDETWNIRGWCGFDFERNPDYPEFFSSFLELEYRHYLLWLAMTHARCQFGLEKGIESIFIRVSEPSVDLFKQTKVSTPIFNWLLPESIDPLVRDFCKACEFYGNACCRQGFLAMDVPKMLQHIQARSGFLPPTFPARFTLDKEKMRNTSPDSKLNLEWKKETSS